jgi:hypothetical protein
MPTLKQRIQAFFNPPLAQSATDERRSDTGAPAVYAVDLYEKLKADRERAAVVKTCIEMYETDSRVKKSHRFESRAIVRGGFFVKTDDNAAKRVAEALQTRLGLNQLLEDAVRETSREGDSFYELAINEALEITEASRKPTLQMHRNSNAQDKFSDPNRAFWWSSQPSFTGEPPKDAIWFPEWQMIHARWEHETNKRYGTPMFASSTGPFKKVVEGELNVAVRRKVSGSQIRHHVVEGSEADLLAYKEENKATFGRLAAVTDMFSNKPGSLTVHQGDANVDKIGDVQHHVATMMTASDVPMELIAYGGDLNRDILGEKKDEYEETVSQGREWLTDQIIKPLLERQWLLAGILPSAVNYKIIWRKGKTITPADLRDLADAGSRLKLLGVKDEIIQLLMASYLRDVDVDLLDAGGFSMDQFAQNLKGISV